MRKVEKRRGSQDIPGLLLDCNKSNCLYNHAQRDLSQERRQDFSRHQARCRPFSRQRRVRPRPTHENRNRQNQQQIDIQELEIAEIRC